MDTTKEFEVRLRDLEELQLPRVDLNAIVSFAISDKDKIVCGLVNGEVCVLESMGQTVMNLQSPKVHKKVSYLLWAGVGRCVSTHEDGYYCVWDLVEYKLLRDFELYERETMTSKFDPEWDNAGIMTDDGRAVFGSTYGNLRVWDFGEQTTKVKAHGQSILCLGICGDKCLTGSADTTVKVWSLQTLQELATLVGHTKPVTIIAVESDSRCMSGSEDSIKFWNLEKCQEAENEHGRNLPRWLTSGPGHYLSVKDYMKYIWITIERAQAANVSDLRGWWEMQGDYLYKVGWFGLHVIDLIRMETISNTYVSNCCCSFVHFFEGKCAVVGRNSVFFVELDQYKEVRDLCGHEKPVNGMLAYGSDKLISWSEDSTIRVWDTMKYQQIAKLDGHKSNVITVILAKDERLISGSEDRTIKVWDLTRMEEIHTSMVLPQPICALAVSPGGGKLVAGDCAGNVVVWDFANYSQIATIENHLGWMSFGAESEDILITTSEFPELRVWNMNTGALLSTHKGHRLKSGFHGFIDENRFITASDDWTAVVWDRKNFKILAKLEGHENEIWTSRLSGEKLITGSCDGFCGIWDLKNYKMVTKLSISCATTSLEFLKEDLFISGCEKGEVRVWSETEYREIAVFPHSMGCISSLASLDDYQVAISCRTDPVVKIWDYSRLSNCLSKCAGRPALQGQNNKAVLPQYRTHIGDFKQGRDVPYPLCNILFMPCYFNALHFCACYNHAAQLSKYLQRGVPLVRGVYGSALTLSLGKKH